MTVVNQSRAQRDGTFGALVALFILVFVRGYPGAQTTGGRIAVCLFVGLALAVIVWGWIMVVRRPSHLEVSDQAITMVSPQGQRTTLSRQSGDELSIVTVGQGRYRLKGLTIAGSGTVITVRFFFSLKEIRKQCLANGWRFAGQ
jgi:hypothetical protein